MKGEADPKTVVSSFNAIPDDEKGDIFVQYCFVNCENTFFAENWWEGLDGKNQALIQNYSNAFFYEGEEFVATENRLVNWVFY